MRKHTMAFYGGHLQLLLDGAQYHPDGTLMQADVINGAWTMTRTVDGWIDTGRGGFQQPEDFEIMIIECDGDPFDHYYKGGLRK